jgi:hypothetical protein
MSMLDLHLNVALVAFLVFALSTQLIPNVLKNVKVPGVKEVVDMLNFSRKGFVYNSLAVALVAGLSSYIALKYCGSNQTCVSRLANLAKKLNTNNKSN